MMQRFLQNPQKFE